MSRVLVTGASGFVAMHIVKELVESGKYIVRGTVRSLENEKKVQPLKDLCPENAKYPLELVEADLLKKETWPDAVKDCTFVIHVASPFPMEDPKDEMEVTGPAVEGTQNVLEACAKTKGGVKRVVLTSSCAAIIGAPTYTQVWVVTGHQYRFSKSDVISRGNWETSDGVEECRLFSQGGRFSEDHVFTEKDWSLEKKGTVYEKSKRRAEKAAWELVKNLPDDEKFELCCINPGLILGPVLHGSSCTSIEFVRSMLERVVPYVIKMSLPISDVRDVAAAHITAMTSPKASGNRYITITGCWWFEEVAKVLEEEFRPLGYDVPSEIKVVDPSIQNKLKMDSSKIQADQGFKPTDLKTTILEMAYNLIDAGFVKRTQKFEEVKGKLAVKS